MHILYNRLYNMFYQMHIFIEPKMINKENLD